MMSSNFFRFQQSTLHYTTLGTGRNVLLLFHGFGQDNSSFQAVSSEISQHYTAYVFDLYFHGQSTWGHNEMPLEKKHWKQTMQQFLQEQAITDFSLAGFSLGCKFVLATLESFPTQVNGIILLAPDGIKTSFWYSLATYPLLFRKLFKSMIRHPERFNNILKFLHKLKLTDSGLLKFASFNMNTEEKRTRVYYSWVVFRRLQFDISAIANVINQRKIPLTLVVGQYDKVITTENMQHLLRQVPHCVFETPASGHTGLIAASGKYFRNLNTGLS
jgi:pimeloyl-ACP methyl ester carboxylesterase